LAAFQLLIARRDLHITFFRHDFQRREQRGNISSSHSCQVAAHSFPKKVAVLSRGKMFHFLVTQA